MNKKLDDRLDLLRPIQVSSSQVYTWLKEEEDDIPLVFDLDDQKRAPLHTMWGMVPYQPLERFHVEIRSWCLEDWLFCGQIQHARDEDQLFVLVI